MISVVCIWYALPTTPRWLVTYLVSYCGVEHSLCSTITANQRVTHTATGQGQGHSHLATVTKSVFIHRMEFVNVWERTWRIVLFNAYHAPLAHVVRSKSWTCRSQREAKSVSPKNRMLDLYAHCFVVMAQIPCQAHGRRVTNSSQRYCRRWERGSLFVLQNSLVS